MLRSADEPIGSDAHRLDETTEVAEPVLPCALALETEASDLSAPPSRNAR